MTIEDLRSASDRARAGGDASKLGNKLPVRRRLELLFDDGSFVEDGLLARALSDDLPADGVITGVGRVGGRHAAVIAHDPSVKAGSWGLYTVEKQIRILERALDDALPVFYLVDSAGGRLTEQTGFFPGRRGAARIFDLQIALSGFVPQICVMLGPATAGGAYMPMFCDWVGMVEGNASMSLASARVAEVVVAEKVSLEDMGGARVHTTISGCADERFADDASALDRAWELFGYLPTNSRSDPPHMPAQVPAFEDWRGLIPEDPRAGYDIRRLIERLVDAGSLLEVKREWAPEIVVGLARLEGRVIGIVANQPMVKGGAIFVDSSDKAARFITWCDAFNIPLIFLVDVPGFMVGSAVEHAGILRHGAKMISAMARAEVPRFCVVVRKAYAAGYYAMSCPGFRARATIALPTAEIGAMSADAAVDAVYRRKTDAMTDPAEREQFVAARRQEYAVDLDLLRLASDLHVDAVVENEQLRGELARRLQAAEGWSRQPPRRHQAVVPV
ncbi:MAG: acyl-CoA carboxylase subunit beta [Acidimicrobiaceae bacterium]|nr:acyl-CoA carboxylase subunit beta [Acidimicrobiaceae bacterium]